MRTLSLGELNRTLLERQWLLRRQRRTVVKAVERLVAMQAQYSPSPYVALWSRLEGFRKEQLTRELERGTAIKASLLRTTLHVVTREDFPFVLSACVDSEQARAARLGVDLDALWAALGDEPRSGPDLHAFAHEFWQIDDRWTVAFGLRSLPFVRTAPLGEWPHTKPSPAVPWRKPLPSPDESVARIVRAYLTGYGPATRDDVVQLTGFKLGRIGPALDGMRTYEDEQGRTLYDLPRAKLTAADAPAPVRFLPPYDSIILAHRDRSRILPDEYYETVIRRKNATTLATFTVDGFIAGAWKVDRVRGKWTLAIEPFAPLPKRVRAEVDAEGGRLVAFYDS